jgi:hypothetical protein
MADPPAAALDLVVLQQQKGDWQEDVAERRPDGLGWLDAEISDSFPASDPLSHWAGPPRDLDEAEHANRLLHVPRAVTGAAGRAPS